MRLDLKSLVGCNQPVSDEENRRDGGVFRHDLPGRLLLRVNRLNEPLEQIVAIARVTRGLGRTHFADAGSPP